MADKRSLIVFARSPDAGRVKTRLAAELGRERALAIYRDLGSRVLAQVRTVSACEIVIAYTPPEARQRVRAWLPGADRYEPQAEGDLGKRMTAAVSGCFSAGAHRVVVIGTDCPSVDAGVIEEAFLGLASADVVLGPASDGGYYLIGLARPLPALFTGIPWSTPDTLSATLERARATGAAATLLAELRDIDTADDWREWQHALRTQGGGSSR